MNIGGAVDNTASAISAGNDLTVSAASVSNIAAANVAFLRITAGEWSEYTAFTPAASALQAAGTLSISAGGQVINSGNVLGQRVVVTSASIVNGITSTIPNIGSTTPSAVISLAGPDFGNGFDAARGSLSLLAGTTVGVPGDAPGGTAHGTDLVTTRGLPGSVRTDRTIPGVGLASGTYGVWGPEITADGPSSATPTASDGFRYLHTNPAAGFLAPLTPEYLLGLLPKNLVEGRNLFFYADPYVEQQLLRQAALRETGQAYFLNGLAFDDRYQVSIDTQQRALLYEAAARFAAENGLTLGQALSPQLQAKLDAPLLWYVEQQVPDPDCSALTADCSGRFVTALVPTVYLPQLYREGNRNLAGGMIRGDDVTLQAPGTITNTGYLLAGNTLSVTARDFLNQKRQADFGKEFQAIPGGWIDITGTRPVSEGGVVAAADLQLNAERIQSFSGEFHVLGRDAADTQARSAAYLAGLRTVYGPQFRESVATANLHYEVHQENDPFEQIAVAALGIGLSLWLGPQMSALVGEAFGATAGAFMGAAGTVQGVAVSAGVGNMVVAGTLTGMATSSATQLVATGSIDLGDAFRSGLTSGLTAGLARGIGEAIGNETLLGGKLVDAGNGQTVVVATDGATSLADKLVGYTVRAATGAGVNQLVYGSNAGDAGTDFVNSLVSSASADAANWIGGNIDGQTKPLGNIGAHALVGCAAAAATGNDCGAGALGAATAAGLNPVLDQITSITDQSTRDAQLAALSTAAAGFLANATGNDIETAIGAGQNETLNNYLRRNQFEDKLKRLAGSDSGQTREQIAFDAKQLDKQQRDDATRHMLPGSGVVLATQIELEQIREEWLRVISGPTLCSADAVCRIEAKRNIQEIGGILSRARAGQDAEPYLEVGGLALMALPLVGAVGRGGAGSIRAGRIALGLESQTASDGYFGVRQASKYLMEQGVPRSARVEILRSFEVETIHLHRAGNAEFGIRYFDGVSAFPEGRYLFETFPASRGSLALDPNWNQMTGIAQWQIRPGTVVIDGRAAAQGVGLEGGQVQKFILSPKTDLVMPKP